MGKKILCIIDTFKIGGGAQTQLAGLAVMLKKHGYDVTAVSYHNVAPEQSFEPYLTQNGIDYICLKDANNMYQKFRGVKQTIDSIKPDTVIAYLDGPTAICSILKMLGGRFRLIVSERNVTQQLNIKEFVKFQLYRFADRVVPNAFSQESFIKNRFSFLANKVQTISNFVDTNRFQSSSVENVKPQKTLSMLVVARVNPQKNVLRFIDTIDILRRKGLDFHISWFGQKSEDYYQQCISKIDSLGVGSYITFHAATKDINKIYSDSRYDVFCLPSLFEGCPNTVAEAMSSGLPILCSNVCDNAIYVENEINGFCFNPHDSINIAETIINFANLDNDRRLQMREQSRQRAVALFSEDSFLKKYLDIL